VLIEVDGGDIIIDAGVGWGDTTVYLAALANQKPTGHSYAFDILDEGFAALSEQCRSNSDINNITPVLKALSDKDGEIVYISAPSPGAKIETKETERKVETISIDTFCNSNDLEKIDFIKMDIEGAEVPALKGASAVIRKFKPKLAISVYHKWDDLLVIPQLIKSIRDDYSFYLDCTTGFGGEAVLYCR
jgi:FkbM family methyltransferase